MPPPLLLAVPAAIAGVAYLNAKASLGNDYRIMGGVIASQVISGSRERKDILNIFYVLEEHARNSKVQDTKFLIFEGREWTYREVYDTVLRYGTWLKTTFAIKSKEVVAIDFENSEKFLFIWFGLWSIGARPAFINYNLTGKALAHCINVSTARIVLVDLNLQQAVDEELRQTLPGVEFVVFNASLEADAMMITPIRQPDSERSEDRLRNMSMLIYTSGTTGLPKPAIVSWNKAIVGSTFVPWFLNLKRSDIFYTCMPLYHSSASILGVLSTLNTGATLSLGRKFSTKTFWPEVRASKATIIQYVGETCRYLLAAKPQLSPSGENIDKQNNVRIAFGNGLRPDIWNNFKERFAIDIIGEFYAATEGTSGAWNLSANDFSRGAIGRLGSIADYVLGSAQVVVELDWETEQPVRDPVTGFCKQAEMGSSGELLYRLDETDISKGFQGYFNNDKATNGKVMKDVFAKGDAFFRTGDVIQKDNEGRTFFSDRIGDTFRWKSENVSTNEVSEVVSLHGSVQEANVYGVELPHHDGRAGCAALILKEEPSERLLADLAGHVKKLPRFAIPLFLRITKSMEKTGTNKQQKHILRSQGVEPEKLGDDHMYWLKNGTYVRFGVKDWEELNGGRVRL